MTEIHKAFGSILLALILMGIITSPDQLRGNVDAWDLQCLSGAMEIENGSNGDECLLLTGSVILNRLNSPKWKGNTIEEVITAYDGGWQYASVTRKGFRTKNASERTRLLAKWLLIYGVICPENVMYQGTRKNGSGVYKPLSNLPGQRATEYFCYE